MSEEKKQRPKRRGATATPQFVDKIKENQVTEMEDRMGQLHNRFVAYISESKLPLPMVVLVLQMLLAEATDQALVKYGVK